MIRWFLVQKNIQYSTDKHSLDHAQIFPGSPVLYNMSVTDNQVSAILNFFPPQCRQLRFCIRKNHLKIHVPQTGVAPHPIRIYRPIRSWHIKHSNHCSLCTFPVKSSSEKSSWWKLISIVAGQANKKNSNTDVLKALGTLNQLKMKINQMLIGISQNSVWLRHVLELWHDRWMLELWL